MRMISYLKKICLLSLTVLISFVTLACTSATAARLTPEEVLKYSDTPCSNARIILHRYWCFEHDWAEPIEAEGLSNLHKVSEEFYRSAQPESGGFASAEKLGIKTIISIRQSDNDTKLAQKEPTSIKLIHIPLKASSVTEEDVGRVMNAIYKAEKPVLVHCRYGADRTGLITAYYRIIFENWDREDARIELYYGGYGHHYMYNNIPSLVLNGKLDLIKSMTFAE